MTSLDIVTKVYDLDGNVQKLKTQKESGGVDIPAGRFKAVNSIYWYGLEAKQNVQHCRCAAHIIQTTDTKNLQSEKKNLNNEHFASNIQYQFSATQLN